MRKVSNELFQVVIYEHKAFPYIMGNGPKQKKTAIFQRINHINKRWALYWFCVYYFLVGWLNIPLKPMSITRVSPSFARSGKKESADSGLVKMSATLVVAGRCWIANSLL